MEIREIGFSGHGKTPNQNSVRIYNPENPLQNPHMTIVVLSFAGSNLEQIASENYNKNISHPGMSAQSINAPIKGVFLGDEAYTYSLKNKGYASPVDEYLGYEGVYKVIWVQHNSEYFYIQINDTP